MATHIDTNTWKRDWKTSYLFLKPSEWILGHFKYLLWMELSFHALFIGT